jgi:hypothetical protein
MRMTHDRTGIADHGKKCNLTNSTEMIGDLHKQNVNPYLTVYYKISTNGFVC